MAKLKREEIEVAFLQETHLTDSEHEKLTKWRFNQYSSSYRHGSKRGVVILISKKLHFECICAKRDPLGRFVLVKGHLQGALVTFLNVYAPPSSEWSFFKQVFELLLSEAQGTLICGGDFNVRLNPILDASKPCRTGQEKTTKNIKVVMREIGLTDVWRELNPTKKDFTFFSHPHSNYSRLDYYLMFQRDIHRVKKCNIGTMDLSDHAPVYLKVTLETEKKDTIWRLNTGILGSMREQIKVDIKQYFDENDNGEVSPQILWDACKVVQRGKIIGYCSNLKKQRQAKIGQLQAELGKLENLHKKTLKPSIKMEINKKKNELNEIYSNDIKKKLTFLKQKYYEAGGKSAKLLAYKLKKQQAESTVHKIRDPSTNTMHYKMTGIQQTFVRFYTNLYTQPKIDDGVTEAFLKRIHLPKVTDEQNLLLTREITDEEIKKAISHSKVSKAPGPDGFPAEWYKEMKDLLAPKMRTTFNHVLKTGITPPSWKEAIISVIPKEGKDKTDCGNYRPISVLNQDYKIYTHIMAKRLEKILPQIISLDQTGFIQQRQTQDSIRRTLHVVEQINKIKLQAVMLSLDAEKAFDRVNWEFLFKLLDKFGFHQMFINSIRSLYHEPKARIKINGAISNQFGLERGTRQGCPLSPLLFALFIEPLSQGITQNKKITGIKILDQEYKISLFADDVLISLSNPDNSILEVLSFLEDFGAVSGYKLNIHKTQTLNFNYKPSQVITSKIQLKWDLESIKYLGVIIPKDLSSLYKLNFDILNKNLKEDVRRWNLVPVLSFESRIETIKMNILPRMLYLFQTLPVEISDKQFSEWDKLLSRYIWQGKKSRIRFQTLQLSKSKGGLALPCLKNYYISAQLRILICWCASDYKARWKEIEENLSGTVPIQARLGDKRLIKCLMEKGNEWINLTLNTWLKVITKNDMLEEVKILNWCSHDPDFAPNKMDANYRVWARQGLSAYCTWFDQATLKSFQTLKRMHSLSNNDFFRFLQVRHHLNSTMLKSQKAFENSLLKVFISAYRTDLMLKVISRLYRGLQEIKVVSTSYIKQKWDRETNSCIPEDTWIKYCELQWKISSSNTWRSFCWKCLIRYFITPSQSSHHTGSSSCWRMCRSQEANHFHLFWACPKIITFWRMVYSELRTVFGSNITFTWEELLFGYIRSANVNVKRKCLFGMLSMAARKAITKKWLKPDIPSIEEWYDIVYEVYVMERITFSMRLQQTKFEDIWKPWKVYVSLRRPSFV